MSYTITGDDIRLTTRQLVVNNRVKIEVYDSKMTYIDTIECGVVNGSCNVDSGSDVRRTASMVLVPFKKVNTLIEPESLIWLNRNIVLYIGIQDHRTEDYKWYRQGTYVISTVSSTYDATTNQLTINCSDFVTKLDGSKNGQTGALETVFPSYREYDDSLDTNFNVEESTLSGTNYNVTVEEYSAYKENDYFIVTIENNSPDSPSFSVNGLAQLPLKNKWTKENVKENELSAGKRYVFKIMNGYADYIMQYTNDEVENGVPLEYYVIRDAVMTAAHSLGDVKEMEVDDIGEFQAMPQYNDDWEQYRKENPLWNNIPFDLEFSVGDSVWQILTEMRDLYPNYEFFFDEYGVFIAQMVPSQIDDDVYIHDDYLQKALISESFEIDYTYVRNVTEVFGASLDADFFSDVCTLEGDTYTATVEAYDTYYTGDYIAITMPETNPQNTKIRINELETLALLDEATGNPVTPGTIEAGSTYVFKIKNKVIGYEAVRYIYLLAQYQPQGIDVLTDGTESDIDWHCQDGTIVKVWSKKYFEDKFNCKNVHFTIDTESPFTIQKIGELFQVLSGDVFDNIESDSRAVNRAIWENWKKSRLLDSISLSILLTPFLDVNKKVTYRRSDKEETEQYIISSVSHDLAGGTSSVSLYRFTPLYMEDHHNNSELSSITYNELKYYKYKKL